MRTRLVSYAIASAAALQAGLIEDVRGAIGKGDFSAAETLVNTYRAQHGVTSELAAAVSWLGRGALAAKDYTKADAWAGEAWRAGEQLMRSRSLESDPQLAIAVGASIEVRAQVMAARGERDQAVLFLRGELERFRGTPIRARLQKNIHLLSLEGKPAPALDTSRFLGPKPQPLTALKGKPVLLFLWAHWCGDCKTNVPALARLRAEFGPRLAMVMPTQLYGYAANGEDAAPEAELRYIDEVRRKYYARLADVPVPVSSETFAAYGASTTPTLVLIDAAGIVRLYHPGHMPYEELKAAVDRLARVRQRGR